MPKLNKSTSHSLGAEMIKIARMGEALSRQMTLICSPVTASATRATGAFTRSVIIKLVNGSNQLHTWAHTNIANALGASVASILGVVGGHPGTLTASTASLMLVGGTQTVTLTGSPGTWATGDIDILRVIGPIQLGGASFATVKSQRTHE